MGHLIAGNTIKNNSLRIDFNGFKDDTILASKTWVKENMDKVKEWAKEE